MTHNTLAVTGLNLINADADTVVRQIHNGDVLVLDDMPGNFKFNLTAIYTGSPGSVFMAGGWFGESVKYNVRTENYAPFAWLGDWAGDYFGEQLRVGCYDLIAVPYSQQGGTGTVGGWARFRFKVVQSAGDPLPADPEVGRIAGFELVDSDTGEVVRQLQNADILYLDRDPLPANFNVQAIIEDPVGRVRFDGEYDDNQSLHRIGRTERISPFTWLGDIPDGDYFGRPMSEGHYRFTATPYLLVEVSEERGESIDFQFMVMNTPRPQAVLPRVDKLILIDATTEEPVVELTNGMQLRPGSPGLPVDLKFNVQAEISSTVRSVHFEGTRIINGRSARLNRVKNDPLFTWFGDSSGDFRQQPLSAATYTVTATPYADENLQGTAGEPIRVTFTVVEV
ncbi:MAG: hypothetical protein AAF653_07300 [Chloroflexota bacterium]